MSEAADDIAVARYRRTYEAMVCFVSCHLHRLYPSFLGKHTSKSRNIYPRGNENWDYVKLLWEIRRSDGHCLIFTCRLQSTYLHVLQLSWGS